MEMYSVSEYIPTCRFLKIINSTMTELVNYFKESTVGMYSPLLNILRTIDLDQNDVKD